MSVTTMFYPQNPMQFSAQQLLDPTYIKQPSQVLFKKYHRCTVWMKTSGWGSYCH